MIALTGYTGFVGQHLLELLNTTDCLLLGRSPLANHSHFYEFDLSQTNDLDLVSKLSKVDVLVHIAARVHIMNDDSTDPLAEFRVINTEGTLNLAKQAAQSGVKRFIFVSSIKVNGESTTDRPPFTAYDNPVSEDPYGVSKFEAEQQLFELGKRTDMEIVIIRPPLVYGEGVKANFASLMRFVWGEY